MFTDQRANRSFRFSSRQPIPKIPSHPPSVSSAAAVPALAALTTDRDRAVGGIPAMTAERDRSPPLAAPSPAAGILRELEQNVENFKIEFHSAKKQVARIAILESSLQELSSSLSVQSISRAEMTKIRSRIDATQQELAGVDARVKSTKEDAAEKSHIAGNEALSSYYNSIQQSFNEAFLYSSILNQGQVATNATLAVQGLNCVATMAGDIPFVAAVFSAASAVTGAYTDAREVGQFSNFQKLNPRSDPVDAAVFAEKLARRFAITNEAEVISIAGRRDAEERLSKIVNFCRSVASHVDSAAARGFFGKQKSHVELLSLKDSKAALEFVLEGRLPATGSYKMAAANFGPEAETNLIVKIIVEAVTRLDEKRLAPGEEVKKEG